MSRVWQHDTGAGRILERGPLPVAGPEPRFHIPQLVQMMEFDLSLRTVTGIGERLIYRYNSRGETDTAGPRENGSCIQHEHGPAVKNTGLSMMRYEARGQIPFDRQAGHRHTDYCGTVLEDGEGRE